MGQKMPVMRHRPAPELIGEIESRVGQLTTGECDCTTTQADYKLHAANCPYRLVVEIRLYMIQLKREVEKLAEGKLR